MLNDPVNDINEHCGLTHAHVLSRVREYHVTNYSVQGRGIQQHKRNEK